MTPLDSLSKELASIRDGKGDITNESVSDGGIAIPKTPLTDFLLGWKQAGFPKVEPWPFVDSPESWQEFLMNCVR